jgi:hypothetical protein
VREQNSQSLYSDSRYGAVEQAATQFRHAANREPLPKATSAWGKQTAAYNTPYADSVNLADHHQCREFILKTVLRLEAFVCTE